MLAGYPPKAIIADNSASISSLFSKGETINVEEDTSAAIQQPQQQPERHVQAPPASVPDKPVAQISTNMADIGDGDGYMVRRKIADDNR